MRLLTLTVDNTGGLGDIPVYGAYFKIWICILEGDDGKGIAPGGRA
jgi:hypothetical protein